MPLGNVIKFFPQTPYFVRSGLYPNILEMLKSFTPELKKEAMRKTG